MFLKLFLRVVLVVLFIQYYGYLCAQSDSLRFPIKDRRGDAFSSPNRNYFDFRDSAFLKQTIEYDPITKQYYIVEKIGKNYYRKPTYLTTEEYNRIMARRQEIEYFSQRSKALTAINRKVQRPKPRTYDKLFDRIFGLTPSGMKVDIKPQGSVDIMLGYLGQNIKNPTLPENARKNGGFDFDMNANLNVVGSIGNKLKLPISYNTQSNFDFENQLKLDYRGDNDEIIKSIEAGNISFQSKGTLIPSAQALFGIKTQLQFGKLYLTAALSQQKSQRQSLTLQGGGVAQPIYKRLDDYEENRHFLLGQYFRQNYNKAMKDLPKVNSQVQILRIEVWVTNRTGATTDARDIAAFTDLAERNPYSNAVQSYGGTDFDPPSNGANNLYERLTGKPQVDENRDPSKITTNLLSYGLKPVEDFEKTFARKLNPNEYTFNSQVGFLSLNAQLQPDEVLAVAYEYTYNGKVYKVGEFSNDVAVDSSFGVQKVLFLKLLKATSQRINLPIWQLMMKNVYSLDVFGLTREDFRLTVLYEEPSGGLKRYLPESHPSVDGRTIISIVNADRLNNRNDPQPDGNYDYVESFTIVPQFGRIIFPVLQPFGRDLDSLAFNKGVGLPPGVDPKKYVYTPLYDSIKAIAQTYANLNRFIIQGQAKGSSSSDIYLGAFNIPPGSVTLTAGGQILKEGIDYTVDYNLGSVKIINAAITSAGVPVNVQFENNAGFGIQQRSFLGLRADYILKNTASKSIAIGASMVRLSERPFFTKMNYGEDPISNTMYGFDFSYRSQFPAMNRWLNKLPNYTSSTMSSITAYGEFAALKPGHPVQIGKGSEGLIYIDDFEGTRNSIDLRFPFISWTLASTPAGRFPEASLKNDLRYGYNRAKLAWYNIEPVLQDPRSGNNPLRGNLNELSDPRVRQVFTNELFPNRTTNITDVQTTTFDLAYYPRERGPYNYTTSNLDNETGRFTNPRAKWGGIMRSIDQTDFETGNVEFIEFWIQDPFIKTNATNGKLIINLGNISEDVLKDGRRFYENGLPTPNIPAAAQVTPWANVPVNPIQVTQAFSTDPTDRPFQDLGFDGFNDDSERVYRNPYLQSLAAVIGASSNAYKKAQDDPSSDNYVWYRDQSYDAAGAGILGRYKHHNNPQGNSPVAGGSTFSPAATLYPDNEDLNRDNTLNETEEYYEYEVQLNKLMDVGITKYITDKRIITPKLANGTTAPENWYLFRVPIRDFTNKYGNIPDFKSIRFIRMFLTDFEDSAVLRFARLDLVRNQWRNFQYKLDTTGSYVPLGSSNTDFNVLAVNVEENSNRTPIPYKIPPGIERVQQLSNNGVNILQNEQAMSLRVTNLQKDDSRSVFKTFALDLRQFGQLSMFIHAESLPVPAPPITDGNMVAVIRLGQDFLNNYYEIKIPLRITKPGNPTADDIWPAENYLDFALQELINLKLRRNESNWLISKIYREKVGNKTFSVLGNPNLGEVRGILVGIENATNSPINGEVWINELRLSKLDERGGWAALGRVDLQLSDLGTITVSANTYTAGFGTIEQRVNERARDNMVQFDAAATIDAGKLLPKNAGITIPIYASINKTIKTPEYDPYDKDVKYKDKLSATNNKDSLKSVALDQTTIKTLNFTNVRFDTRNPKNKLWSIKNFDFTYSFTRFEQSTPLITQNKVDKHRVGFGYTFNGQSKYIHPFKKVIRSKSVWLSFIKDFNFNYTPSLIGYRADVQRQFGEFIPRLITTDLSGTKVERVDTTYDKFFTFDRYYNFRYDLTRSLNIDFSAVNNARIDEPYGRIDTREKKDTVRRNFLRGGRNTNYSQRAVAAYTLPLSKFPIVDWVTARYSYGTTYNWIGASLIAREFGNIIENSQDNTITGEFDFTRLYGKFRFLRSIDQVGGANPTRSRNIKGGVTQANADKSASSEGQTRPYPTKEEALKGLTGKARTLALRKWRAQRADYRRMERQRKLNTPMEMNDFVRFGGRLFTMVKRGSVNYTESYRSRVPGFMDSTKFLGQNWSTMQPGLDYVFGRQPDTNWLNQKFRDGVLSRDTMFNLLYRQNFEQKLTITAQIEPIRDLTIDINLDKSYTKEYSELFKDTSSGPNRSGIFTHNNPLAAGGFSVSYIGIKTLFKPFNPNGVSETFKEFEANRIIIAQRLANANPYWQALPASQKYLSDGFPNGYSRYSQDVLIPAFIAAYGGKNPNSVGLLSHSNSSIKTNPFKGIKPMPNWRATYTGLTRIPALAKIFSNVTLTHGYNGTLSMNSFTSALNYYDPLGFGTPGFIDTISNNFVPFFLVPNLTMQEQFSPLIGIDITTNSQWNVKFEYRKSRQLSLSLIDYQLSEVRSTEFTFGTSYRKRGFKFPFPLPFTKNRKLENDINFRLDVGIRDDAQSNSRLDQENAYSTGGQKVITIMPSVDYILNNRVNIKLYFDQRRVIPYISTSPPITTTRAGLQIRISLAQ